jgi:hypothetical protein
MNVGVVIDGRGTIPPDVASSMRALLKSFLKHKDVGDRFSLTVAGKPGGLLVDAEHFRHGPVTVAMTNVLTGSGPASPEGPVLGLVDAVETAVRNVQRTDDPTAPLGSSLVILVSSQPWGALTDPLSRIAHRSAVGGIPVTVVGLGDSVQLEEIERVTLSGQGNRRLLRSAAESDRLVERELSALSRVAARAARLRIRLAPGVKLVEVIGSSRLDETGAVQVRQAERSIDRRLSRNLGIEADRGEDEAGIQIVIPTYYAGDSHAFLLDVVVPGPGPVADVTLRYKDLVYLENGVARANLSLGTGTGTEGPMERNVLKNLLAIRLSETLKDAGRAILAGEDARAIALVRDFRALLESLGSEVAGFEQDPELRNDVAMLDEYLTLMRTAALQRGGPRGYLADSLQLAGYFRILSRSPSD